SSWISTGASSAATSGTSDTSIVIRDGERLVAEIWRENVLPPLTYGVAYSGDSYRLRTGGWLPTSPGTIERDGSQVGAFRRPGILSRNILVAFKPDIPDELKVVFCSVALLQ
ncbi:MAG TPA: hypothetical protein VKG78_01825, partial [Opitutaceae bacterium]|nr:hypothetical protein [Opitutaceae bacterium]